MKIPILALVHMLLSLYVFAEGDDDIFDLGNFQDSVTESQTKSETTDKLNLLFGANINISESNSVFLSDLSYAMLGKARAKIFAKISNTNLGALYVSTNIDQTLNVSSNNIGYQSSFKFQDVDFDAPTISLSELHYSIDIDKIIFLRFGQQIIGWGAAYFWSAADFINQSKADSQAPFDARAGKTGLRVHIPLGDSNIFGFVDLSSGLQYNQVLDLGSNISYALKFDTKLLGFEIGLIGQLAPSRVLNLGATLSGSLFTIDWWGEYGIQTEVYDKELEQSFVVGFEKSFSDQSTIKLRGEFFYQTVGKDDAVLNNRGSLSPYYTGKYYVYGYFGLENISQSNWSVGLSTIWNLSDFSSNQKLTVSTKLLNNIPLSASIGFNQGAEKREFTLRQGGNSWDFSISMNFEL